MASDLMHDYGGTDLLQEEGHQSILYRKGDLTGVGPRVELVVRNTGSCMECSLEL